MFLPRRRGVGPNRRIHAARELTKLAGENFRLGIEQTPSDFPIFGYESLGVDTAIKP